MYSMDYVVIAILLYFSHVPRSLTLVESIGVDTNIQTKEKHTIVWRPNNFQIAGRTQNGSAENNGGSATHYAMWHTKPWYFYGLRADISIWASPNQGHSQQSGAAIMINCQDGGLYSTFVAGFHVCPALYNNNDVRFFTYWTKDGSKSTGCYDLRCPGYVPANGASLWPGQAVAPPSTYGQQDHYATLSLNKDPNSGDWVLYRHDLDTPSFLGHFPGDLCPNKRGLVMTGFVNYPQNTPGPPMGSGHFPEEDVKRSAYFKHIKLYNSKGHTIDIMEAAFYDYVDKPYCYNETDIFHSFKKGDIFYYGGPSGCIG